MAFVLAFSFIINVTIGMYLSQGSSLTLDFACQNIYKARQLALTF